MRTASSDNCLTCLRKLEPAEATEQHVLDATLQPLLLQHTDWQPQELAATRLPRQLCGNCHQQLLECGKFQERAQASRQQLLAMLEQPTTFEFVYEQKEQEEEQQQQQQQQLLLPDPIDEPVEQAASMDEPVTTRRRGAKNRFKCVQCGHSFAHSHTLAAHVRKVHEGQRRPFQCERCDKTYSFMGGLYTHIREIHEPTQRSYRCDQSGCERVYSSAIAMRKHQRLKHGPPEAIPLKRYVCEACGATFNQTANLKHHRRTKHPTAEEAAAASSEEHFCERCQKHFHSRYTLKYHTLQQHGGVEEAGPGAGGSHECGVCGRRLAKRFMLVQHMLMHSAEKLPCEHCGRPFARRFELEAHVRAVHLKLKPFACGYCAESFASRKTLRHHEYIHTGEKPYVCNVCGQGFRQQTCLKNHGRVHDKHKAPPAAP